MSVKCLLQTALAPWASLSVVLIIFLSTAVTKWSSSFKKTLLSQSVILITRYKSGTILFWEKIFQKMPLSNYLWCPMMNKKISSIFTFKNEWFLLELEMALWNEICAGVFYLWLKKFDTKIIAILVISELMASAGKVLRCFRRHGEKFTSVHRQVLRTRVNLKYSILLISNAATGPPVTILQLFMVIVSGCLGFGNFIVLMKSSVEFSTGYFAWNFENNG